MKFNVWDIRLEYRTEILHRSIVMLIDIFSKFHRLQMRVYLFGDSGNGGIAIIEPFKARRLVAIKNIQVGVSHNGFKHRTGKFDCRTAVP